jgi:two-component system chemotaxis sensor kinase CheA
MNPLLEQFLSEAKDVLQAIGERLMQLEDNPDDPELMSELFRLVHTLKGNSGLFEFPEMTRVLHAGEDLMDAVRHGRVAYSKELADRLLDSMDFVGMLCDELEAGGCVNSTHSTLATRLGESLRDLITAGDERPGHAPTQNGFPTQSKATVASLNRRSESFVLWKVREPFLMEAFRRAARGSDVSWLTYVPREESFFQGDDPFFQAQGTPELLWGDVQAREPWPDLLELDAYRCLLTFHLLTAAPRAELDEYFRYMPDQVAIVPIAAAQLVAPEGTREAHPENQTSIEEIFQLIGEEEFGFAGKRLSEVLAKSDPKGWLSSALRWLLLLIGEDPEDSQGARAGLLESIRAYQSRIDGIPSLSGLAAAREHPPLSRTTETEDDADALSSIIGIQRHILDLPVSAKWHIGRMKAVIATLSGCLRAHGDFADLVELETTSLLALEEESTAPLLRWIDQRSAREAARATSSLTQAQAELPTPHMPVGPVPQGKDKSRPGDPGSIDLGAARLGKRLEDAGNVTKSLKVDQIKIDRLMNLIGEMVVSKNGLPYLAGRAETVFGVRELSREIKTQYAVINRIAEEMQDAIMQIRMMPVSFIFQRFPRLVRDTSRRLGKEVHLVVSGEETEADKNIIESLGDPLVHIIRNSLDHGFEMPDVRRAAAKPAFGTLTIRAKQDSGRVTIEISDDGKGIDPLVIKRRAYEKGLIEEATLDRLSDQEAINLVFAPGFSTAEVVSDLSGRGVGMDVVRSAVEKVNGTVVLESEKGKGTRISLSLPLSLAVTNVMIIEAAGQLFGVPLEYVVETVRIPRSTVRTIKNHQATVLRGRIVPLKSINVLLGLGQASEANGDDELAVLVVRLGSESIGLLVDSFRETLDIILKPMAGVLAGLQTYSGSALLGDGSVLMVLNIKGVL